MRGCKISALTRAGSGAMSYAVFSAGRMDAEIVEEKKGELTGTTVTSVRRVRWKSKPSNKTTGH